MNKPIPPPALSAQCFFDILGASPDGVLIASGNGTIVYASTELCRLFGYAADELIGESIELLVLPAERHRHVELRAEKHHHRRTHEMANQLQISGRHKDGHAIPVAIRLGTTMSAAGLLTVAYVSDVAETRNHQAELMRLNSALSLVHDCNEALVRADDEDTLLSSITQRLAAGERYASVWIGLADDESAAAIRLAASSGSDSNCLVRGSDSARGSGPAGDAIRRHEPTVVQGDGKEQCLILPFSRREGVLGCLAVHTQDPLAFGADERSLLRELADDLAYGISSLRTHGERARQQQLLLRQSLYDTITGLPNRQMMISRIDEALRNAPQATAVLVIGLDHFSAINETYGHAVGDRVLAEAASRLCQALRRGDAVGRLSGDEFVVLLAELSTVDDVAPVADKLREALNPPFAVDAEGITVSATIGAAIPSTDGLRAETMVTRAEAAMMSAKDSGRNSFAFYRESEEPARNKRLSIARDLNRALEKGEFAIHFQPVVDLQSGLVTGAEALLRWTHPVRGPVSPAEFIPIAEDNGLIFSIGRWVLESACRQAALWQGDDSLSIAINLSARQFHDPKLEQDILDALEATGLPATALILEITESVLLGDLDLAIGVLHRLRAQGVRFALDDFGTGYSSLAYLKRLPMESVKIDRAFVRDIASDPNDAAIVAAIIAMAHALGLRVTAEGVEHADQLAYLRGRGCDELQGYWFSPPVDAAAFEALRNENGRRNDILAHAPGLLIVDDEPSIGQAIRRLLRKEYYPIHFATSGQEGLEILARHPIGVIISDQRMPMMSGAEFLGRAREICPRSVRVVLSGYADLDAVTTLINEGAIFRYLSKPWNDELLKQTIRDAFVVYNTA